MRARSEHRLKQLCIELNQFVLSRVPMRKNRVRDGSEAAVGRFRVRNGLGELKDGSLYNKKRPWLRLQSRYNVSIFDTGGMCPSVKLYTTSRYKVGR